jgi:hypothetical protein
MAMEIYAVVTLRVTVEDDNESAARRILDRKISALGALLPELYQASIGGDTEEEALDIHSENIRR